MRDALPFKRRNRSLRTSYTKIAICNQKQARSNACAMPPRRNLINSFLILKARCFIELLLIYLRSISIISAMVAVVFHFAYYKFKGWPIDLKAILTKAISGFAVPTGIALLICALDIDLLKYIDDLALYIFISAVAIVYITLPFFFRSAEQANLLWARLLRITE